MKRTIPDLNTYTVVVPCRVIGREELAEMLGYAPATLGKDGRELPPSIKGSNNRWYYPVVHNWLLQQSS